MGLQTYVDKTLGLTLTPRIEKIIKAVHANEDIEKSDILYLIDEAARFTTIEKRVKSDSYKLKDSMLDEEYEIKSLLGDLMNELGCLEASRIGNDGTYRMELPHFASYSDYRIEKLSYDRVHTEVIQAIRMVKEAQESFDVNGDDLKVVAQFTSLVKKYKVDMPITADSNPSEVTEAIVNKVVEVIKKEAEEKQAILARLVKN